MAAPAGAYACLLCSLAATACVRRHVRSSAAAPAPSSLPLARRRSIAAEIAALPGTSNIGWLRVSAKPLKQALGTWASKWVYVFTKYLQDKV